MLASTSSLCPNLCPPRISRTRNGAWLMLSMPPATYTSPSPARIALAAIMTALRPDPHTLLIVVALTVAGSPAPSAACRAGAWPAPACTTCPMSTSSTLAVSIPARSTAARTATAPRPGALCEASPPSMRPIGVRAPLRMTASLPLASLAICALPGLLVPDSFEVLICVVDPLRDDARLPDGRHEVGVAAPARHDVLVQVLGDARTRGGSLVDADIEALRLVRVTQHCHGLPGERHQLVENRLFECQQVAGVLVRHDHQVAVVVRVQV